MGYNNCSYLIKKGRLMKAERKKIIQFALEQNIDDINTYSGYKGDLIVKISSKDKNAVVEIRRFALSLGVKEVVIKQNPHLLTYEVYCVTHDENVYQLKLDDDDKDHTTYVEDSWKKTMLN